MTHTKVSDWRDNVSEFMGYTKSKLEEMHGDIRKTNGIVVEHDKRIGKLEEVESNRKAVKAYLAGIWAIIGGAVVYALQKLAPLAWSIFK